MVVVNFEPLNPVTPDPDLAIFLCFLEAIGEFQFFCV